MRIERTVLLLAVVTVLGFTNYLLPAHAQESFYKDKAIRLVVGLAPGGGYDLYARVIARHMGKHIPGNPTIVVENMTDAGSQVGYQSEGGEALEGNVKEIFNLEPSLVAKLKTILK